MPEKPSGTVVEGLRDDDDIESKRRYFLFGRDVSKIPCFKETFTYSILGGLGCGLLTFMSTSRIRLSTDVSVGSFVVITLYAWFSCRLQKSRDKEAYLLVQKSIREYAQSKGTKQDPSLKDDDKDS